MIKEQQTIWFTFSESQHVTVVYLLMRCTVAIWRKLQSKDLLYMLALIIIVIFVRIRYFCLKLTSYVGCTFYR